MIPRILSMIPGFGHAVRSLRPSVPYGPLGSATNLRAFDHVEQPMGDIS